jgi:hypothetical protein
MACHTCDELLTAYGEAVSVFKDAVQRASEGNGADSSLAAKQAARLGEPLQRGQRCIGESNIVRSRRKQVQELPPTGAAKDVHSLCATKPHCDFLAKRPSVNFLFVLVDPASDVVNRGCHFTPPQIGQCVRLAS